MSLSIGSNVQNQKPVSNLFQLYNIAKVKRFTGSITISNKINIQIKWSSKGFFILKQEDKVLAHAKSSELYWKIMFLTHKINSTTS
ncbi:MAG: hypothetical protein ACXAC7_03780 [Candidatus Hodarchaeales archaeon]